MKILAFVDSHGSPEAMRKIEETAKKEGVKYILCAGDVTIFGNEYKKIMEKMDKIGITVLYVHGNHEGEEESRKICSGLKNVVFLHKKVIEDGDVVFVGFGGGGFSKRDIEFEQWGLRLPKYEGKKIVLMTHAPPLKTKLDDIWGESAGNESFRRFIEGYKPVIAISGHLHENRGRKDKIGKTVCVNPGPWGELFDI